MSLASTINGVTLNNLGLTLFGSLVIPVIILILYRLLLHPLAIAKIPGPFQAKLSGSWRNGRYWKGQWHEDVLQLHKTYGAVVRIAPNEVSIVDANALKLLYNHGAKSVKTDWYHVWQPPDAGPALFPSQDRKFHAFLKKRVSAAYSMSAMLRYEKYIQECLDLMMRKLKKHAEAGNTIDMAKWTGYLAFDIVGTLGYGAPLGMLETESDVMALQENIHQGFWLMSNMGHYWGQARWLSSPISQKIFESLGVENFFAMFDKWTAEKLAARRKSENESEREDMLSHFLNMKAVDGSPAEDKEILVEALNLV